MLCLSFWSDLPAYKCNSRKGLIWPLALMLCSLWTFTSARGDEPSTEPAPTLRVMAYNIHHGRGMDGKVDLNRLADVILASKADLVALQEVDNKAKRSGNVDQAAKLARMTGMHSIFGKQIDLQGGEYGQAILSRFPLSEAKVHQLIGKPEWEQRIALSVEVSHPKQKLTFVSTHLNHMNEENRIEQVEQLNELAEGWQHPAILAGDFNALPTSEPIQILGKKWVNATNGPDLFTFPADRPGRQLDYVFFAGPDAFEVLQSEVIPEAIASDHRPIVVDLRFKR